MGAHQLSTYRSEDTAGTKSPERALQILVLDEKHSDWHIFENTNTHMPYRVPGDVWLCNKLTLYMDGCKMKDSPQDNLVSTT
ncbi:unnamed protein product [Caretta caretta]